MDEITKQITEKEIKMIRTSFYRDSGSNHCDPPTVFVLFRIYNLHKFPPIVYPVADFVMSENPRAYGRFR